MSKVLWIDTETTGLDPDKNAMIQLAYLVEIGGGVVEEGDFLIRPFEGAKVDEKALEINKRSGAEIMAFDELGLVMKDFKKILAKYVNKFNKLDKFVLAGYNVSFDEQFLRSAFTLTKDKFFGSWFFWPKREVASYVSEHIAEQGLRLKNYKLETLCKHFSIEIQAHEAMSDIAATRDLYYILRYSNPR